MADYMMSYGLDSLAERRRDLVGPKTQAWVERVHERYVPRHLLQPVPYSPSHRPAYKMVSARIDGTLPRAKL
jgi:hypothetical protein